MSGFAYRRDIDGLRAVAVLLVLVFHFKLVPLGSAGFIGVDVFFVISGYLITSIVWRQLEEGKFGFGAFYAARVRRLAPALAVALLGTLVYGAFRLTPVEFEELARQAAAAQFYVSNIYYWRNINYFGLQADQVPLLHTWSLAVEEQFYLLYPVLLVLLHRRLRRFFWPALAVLALVSFALNIAFVESKAMATFYLLPTRAWELLAGALLAAPAVRIVSRAGNEALGVIGLAAIAAAVLLYEDGVGMPGWFALYPVVGAMALLLAGADGRTWTSRLLAFEPAVLIGKISYVAYLVHWPIHVFAHRHWGDGYGLDLRWAMFVVSLAVAWLVWRLIETPVRERRWFAGSRSVVVGYGITLVLSAGITFAAVATDGLPQRLPDEAARLAAYALDKTSPSVRCEYSGAGPWQPLVSCRIGQAGVEPRWLVFGDSHAWAGHDGFDRWLKARGESAWFAYRNSCPPLTGVRLAGDRTDICLRFNESVFSWLAAQPKVDGVLLVSTWIQVPEGRLSDEPSMQRMPERSMRIFAASLGRTLHQLKAQGKTVYVWGPVPGARAYAPHSLAQAAWFGGDPKLELTRMEHDQQYGFFYTEIGRHAPMIDVLVIPADTLCVGGTCRILDGGRVLYHDNAHVTASTSDVWAGLLLDAEKRRGRLARAP